MRTTGPIVCLLLLSVTAASAQEPTADPPAPAADPAPAAEPAAAPVAEPAPVTKPTPAPTPTVDIERTDAEATSAGSMSFSDVRGGSPRAKGSSWIVLPKGDYEVGGDLTFITTDEVAQELEFTDLSILHLYGRYGLGRIELGTGVSVIAKQRSDMDEPVFQAAGISTRIAIKQRYAMALNVAGGFMMNDLGMWGVADVGVQTKRILDPRYNSLVFEAALGSSYTHLAFDDDMPDAGFAEAVGSAELVFRTPGGEFSMMVGAEYRIPYFATPRGVGAPTDPQTRLGVHLGGVFSLVKQWDVFAQYQVVDRGDKEEPRTQIPILDGGFDSVNLVFGVQRRFEKRNKKRDSYYIAE